MRGELSRYQSQELSQDEPEYVEISPQEKAIETSRQQVSELYKSAVQLPPEARDLIERLCLAQQAILEEQLHAMHPEQHPQETIGGDVYHHRKEALMHLDRAVRELQSRDIRTIDASQEQ
jgi:hypothetical protein